MKKRLSRRTFLKKGSKTIAAAAVAPYLLKSDIANAMAARQVNMGDLGFYYNRFGVDENIINTVMAEAMSRGGDYCDIYFQHSIVNSIGLEDNVVNRAYSRIGFGVGVRVLKGDQTGYSFTEEITSKAMKLAAKTAANIADSPGQTKPVQLKLHKTPNYYKIKTGWPDVTIDSKIPYLQKINDKVFAADKRVVKCNVWFNNSTNYILIANSNGRIVCDYQPMVVVFVDCVAEHNGRRENNYSGISGRNDIGFLTSENIDYVASEAVRRTVDLFEAVQPKAGEMPVVLAAGNSGILIHEAMGHGMEADFNRKGVSVFSEKRGKPVAEKFVTIVDDGTMKNNRGSINIDDEGNDTEKTFLVTDGILKSYMHDHISAKHYKVKPTGNGRRQSFRFPPIPRMRNTYMLPGPHKKEEIIESVKNGLYAEVLSNGQVDIGAGDFTFYVKSGRLIEDGKLTSPVKDTNIIGNGPQALKDIIMVADDLEIARLGGTCGKSGQSAAVSDGLPTVKVSKMTVGGV